VKLKSGKTGKDKAKSKAKGKDKTKTKGKDQTKAKSKVSGPVLGGPNAPLPAPKPTLTKEQKQQIKKLETIRKQNDKINDQIFQLQKAIDAAKREGKAKLQAAARKCNGKCERSEQQGGVFVGPKGVPNTQTRTVVVIGDHNENKKRYTAVKTKGLNWNHKFLKKVGRDLKDLDKLHASVKAMHRSKYYKYPVYEPKRKGNVKFPKMLMKRDADRLKRENAARLAAEKAKALAKLRISGAGGRIPGVKYGRPKPAVKGGKGGKTKGGKNGGKKINTKHRTHRTHRKGGLLGGLIRDVKKGLKHLGHKVKRDVQKLGKGIKKESKQMGRGLGKIVRAVVKAVKAVKSAIVGRHHPPPPKQPAPRPVAQNNVGGGVSANLSAKIGGGLNVKATLRI